jgi:uncharacterized protein (DUF427 family)
MEQNAPAQAKPIKIPGPEHPISVERNSSRVVVSVAGRVIADTREALTLHEAHYPAFQYIPRKDVDMAQLTRSDSTTYCPYKGDAAYFNIPVGGELSIDAVWSYETPYAAVAGIKDHLASYPYRVDAIAPKDGPPVGKRDGEHRPRQNCDELQKAAMTKRYLEDFATGQTFGSGRLRVDRERIRTFAAEFDPQPFRLDEEAARPGLSADWPRAVGTGLR